MTKKLEPYEVKGFSMQIESVDDDSLLVRRHVDGALIKISWEDDKLGQPWAFELVSKPVL